MTIECLDAGENLSVVSAGNQDLCARANGGLEDGEGSGGELVLFNLSNFVLAGRSQCLEGSCGAQGVRTSAPTGASRGALCSLISACHVSERKLATYWIFASTILSTWKG
jgi:hypothetical protein